MLLKSLKTLLGFSLLGFVGVWIGCSSDASPVAPQAAGKTHLTLTSSTDSDGDGIPDADSTQTADSDGDGIPDADSTTYITFADPNLTAAVWEALGWPVPTTRLITAADMDSLTTLNANGRGITSLVGLEHATNLDTLNLGGNQITDLSPLAGLTNLKQLLLASNQITDLSPLAGLTNLKELRMRRNKYSDLSPLSGLINLTKLGIGINDNLDGDLSDLRGLTKLEWLKVNAMGIDNDDLSSFFTEDHLTKLEWLDLSGNPITNIEPLICLPELKWLWLRFRVGDDSNQISENDVHLRYLIDTGVGVGWTHGSFVTAD